MALKSRLRHARHRASAARASSAAMWCGRWPSGTTASAWRCAGRSSAGHLQPLGRVGQIHAVQANVRYPHSVAAAVRDADVVINLVGILFERGRQRFDAVQAEGAEAVARAAGAVGARMVHVSAIGADANSTSHYARSKAEGERLVLAAQPRRDDHAALDRVRARGRFLQPLRGAGAHLPGAAACRRRPHALPAGLRRRRRRSHRHRGRRRRQGRARSTSSAARRCARSAS